ncbi:11419_t:CDS:2, partial [Scutellospora calospora]
KLEEISGLSFTESIILGEGSALSSTDSMYMILGSGDISVDTDVEATEHSGTLNTEIFVDVLEDVSA